MKKILYLLNRALPSSTIITILLPCWMGVSTAFAGNVITSGTKLKVLPGTTSVSTSNLEIKNGASFNNGGLLILKNCLFNENSGPNPLGSGMVKLNGTTCQTLTGNNSFQNLVIDNPSDVIIGGNTSVSGTLTLINGKVVLGDNNLLMGPYSNVSGTPSSTSMIVATAAGELRKNFLSGFTGSFTFPVGDNTDTPEYSPVTLNFIAGIFITDNYIGINLKNFKYSDPLIANNYLKRYWSITQSGISGLNCNAVYQYVQADVVGNESLILCTKIFPAPVLTYGPANTTTNQLAANAILSFGTYTGGSLEGGSPPVLTGPTQVCANSNGNVYITDAGKTNYQWVVSAGGTITAGGTTTDNTVTISWNTSGPQTVSVDYDGASGPTILNVTVNPLLPVSVSIVASANPVCAGTSTTFTATPVNGGTTPSYQWYKEANPVGGNSPTYSYVPVNGDAISVKLTSSETCKSNSPATSNTITMAVNPVLPVSVSIVASSNPVCAGTSVTFTATPINGGTTPEYQWYKGVNPVGGNSPVYSYVPVNGDAISVKLTSSETCKSNSPATSNTITMMVNPVLPVSVSIVASANPVCTGTSVTFTATPVNGGLTPVYQWYKGLNPVGGNSPVYSYVPANGDAISVKLTSSETCKSNSPATSNTVTMTVNPLPVPIITGSNSVCLYSAGNIYITDPGMTGYLWNLSAGGILTAGAGTNTITVTWNIAGAQSVSVNYTNVNNCTASAAAVKNITVNTLPSPTITGPSAACIGATDVVYSTESKMTGYTWTISQGGTITNGADTNTIAVTWNATGSNFVTVNYQNSNGCSAQSPTTKSVTVNELPVPVLNGPAAECLNNTSTYSTDAGQSNYAWSVSEGGIITEGFGSTYNTVKVKWISTGPQTISVNYTNSNGCSAAMPTVLNVNVLGPNLSGPEYVCKLSTHVYTTEPGMGNTYVWVISPGGIKIAGGGPSNNTCTIKWIATGSRYVKVTYTNNNCTSTATLPVNVSNSSPSLFGPSYLCVDNEGVFSTEEDMSNYIWTISPGGTINEPSNSNMITAHWSLAGPHWIKVTYTSPSCTMTPTTFYLTIWELPVPSLSGPAGPICSGSSGNTYTTDPGKKDYSWTVSHGNVITMGGENTDNTITITWIEPGPQYVSVNYHEKHLCSAPSPTVLNVTVDPLPVPVITGPESAIVNTTCQYNTDVEMSNYEWVVSSGGTITSGGDNGDSWVSVLWSVVGSQSVSINYTDANDCSAAEPTVLPVTVNPNQMLNYPISNNEVDIINNLNETNKNLLPVFSVYPVPNNGKFTLSISSRKTDTYSISIINSLGAEVYNLKNLSVNGIHKQKVDIGSVSDGVYMIIIRNAEGQASKRILINK